MFTEIAPAARSVAENSDAGRNVGLPVAATDGDGETLTYSLSGTDAAAFEIVSTNGQIQTKQGVTYDYETKSSYSVIVSVTDDTHTGSITVTITLTDVIERPAKPDAPDVFTPLGTTDILSVIWTAPEDFDKEITDYDVRYRVGGNITWIDFDHTGTGLTATITGLAAGTAYEVQVRATNEDGSGDWSDSGRAATGILLEVSQDWGLLPAGVTAGGTFRLLFATSTTRDGTSTDIADYNSFVQTAAAAGHADIQAYSSDFTVVASTAAVDARDNTGTTGAGVPIHWLGGNKVADHYADFYDGDWDDEANSKNESGAARSLSSYPEYPFTGSKADGTEATVSGDSRALGASFVRVGRPNDPDTTALALTSFTSPSPTESRPFYALSPVFVVGPGITVPANWSLTPDGLAAGDTFRLLFATSTTRDGTSTDIADYNSFVQTATAAGHTDIRAYSDGFTVVGSTAAVNARDNTGTTYTDDDQGLPIYWLGGNQVADDYADFYDGDWDDEANSKDESGNARSLSGAPTSPSPEQQQRHRGDGRGSKALGRNTVTTGRPDSSGMGHGPLSSDNAYAGTFEQPFYALSPVFVVSSEIEVASNWGLIPTGLTTGARFRLLFISSTGTKASSSDIADYNSLVQTAAAGGHMDIQNYSHTFRMVGSTEAVNARDNTAMTGTGVPIYWLDGAKLADDYADFYDGDWDEEATGRRETGAAVTLGSSWQLWTGSAEDGTGLIGSDNKSRALGNAGNEWVGVGRPNNSSHGPLAGNTANRTGSKAVYALSGVFAVGTQAVVQSPPVFTDTAPGGPQCAREHRRGGKRGRGGGGDRREH